MFRLASEGAVRLTIVLVISCLLLACQTPSGWQAKTSDNLESVAPEINESVQADKQMAVADDIQIAEIAPDPPRSQVLVPASQAVSRPFAVPNRSSQRLQGGDIELNFANTPVATVAEIIFGDHLNQTYEIAPEVSGGITYRSQHGLAEQDLIPVLETLLGQVNANLVSTGTGYRIEKGRPNNSAVAVDNTRIIPLRFIDAAEFAKVLQNISVQAAVVESSNQVVVSGSSAQLAQAQALAKSFDLNWLKGKSVGLFEVRNTSATQVRAELLSMFGNQINTEVAGGSRLIALDRTNSVMVIATSNEFVRTLGEWVTRLDKLGDDNSGDFYIYRVQNGKATDLARLVRDMFSSQNPNYEEASPQGDGPQPNSSPIDDDFRVIADESTNSLVVTGSPHYFNKVRRAMAELDSAPLQVLVEARIMELTLTDELEYGLEWFLQGSRASSQTSGSLDFGDAGINVPVPGFNYVIERAGEVRATLNALADDSRLKVLSSPSLMVLNNQTANIRVGDEVPIPTRQAVSVISPDAPTVNEIQYRNTGILLTVTPRVNSSGMVTMDISQEVSSVALNRVSQIDAPTIQQRQLNSTISVQSGQTVVLGGLMREQQFGQEAGVPVLKKIPGVGKLFSTTSNQIQRTELVAMITPRVVITQADAAAVTREFQQKLIGLQPLPLNEL